MVFDDQALRAAEKLLTEYIGPLARVVVKREAAKAGQDLARLYQLLAEHIPVEQERVEFLTRSRAMRLRPTQTTSDVTPAGEAAGGAKLLHQNVLLLAEQRLAAYLGPLAKILVKREAQRAGSVRELYLALAAHIDSEQEKRRFLASLDGKS
jgi:hypothetical protein